MPRTAITLGRLVGSSLKQAGLLWKDLKKPVPLMSQQLQILDDESADDYDIRRNSIFWDAERRQAPRLLTRLFSSPVRDYALIKRMLDEEGELDPEYDNLGNRALLGGTLLQKLWPERYGPAETADPGDTPDVVERELNWTKVHRPPQAEEPSAPKPTKVAAILGHAVGLQIKRVK